MASRVYFVVIVIMLGTRESMFSLESGIHLDPILGIRNPRYGIRNPRPGIWNPITSWIPFHKGMIKACFKSFGLPKYIGDQSVSVTEYLWVFVLEINSFRSICSNVKKQDFCQWFLVQTTNLKDDSKEIQQSRPNKLSQRLATVGTTHHIW